MDQVRHRNAKSAEHYIHNNLKIQGVLQKELQNGIYSPTADISNNETTLAHSKENIPIDTSNNIKIKVNEDPSPTKKYLKQEMKKEKKSYQCSKER